MPARALAAPITPARSTMTVTPVSAIPADPRAYGRAEANRAWRRWRAWSERTGATTPTRCPVVFAHFCAAPQIQGFPLYPALEWAHLAAESASSTWAELQRSATTLATP